MPFSPDQIFHPLAVGLSQLEWTTDAIEEHLRRRLPPRLRKIAPELARELVHHFPHAAAPDAKLITTGLAQSRHADFLIRFVGKTGMIPELPTEPPQFRPLAAFADCGLPALHTPTDLADWLALGHAQLARFSDLRGLSARTDNAFAPHYRHHLLPKSDGALRLIEEPKPVLKTLQRRILSGILDSVPPHQAAFGFCPGRNCAQAAALHAGEAMVVGFDLKSFFPSIAQHRVYGLFRSLGYPAAVAGHLAGLCTALTPATILATKGLAARQMLEARHLPQGAPTSPALANLVAFALDVRLAGLARKLNANYTRYADDLCFSGDARIASTLLKAVPKIIRESGFEPNPAKTRVQPAHGRQTITGIVVNQHINLPRPAYDRLKAQIHALRKTDNPDRTDPVVMAALEGRITWLEQLNPHKGQKLRVRLARALGQPG